MQKTGIVIGIEDKLALINVLRPSECGDKCSNCAGSCDVKSMTVKVDNLLKAKVGDSVALELSSTQFVKSTFQLYTLPLISFVIGLFIGYMFYDKLGLPSEDMGALLGGFTLMIVTYIIMNIATNQKVERGGSILHMSSVIRKDNIIHE